MFCSVPFIEFRPVTSRTVLDLSCLNFAEPKLEIVLKISLDLEFRNMGYVGVLECTGGQWCYSKSGSMPRGLHVASFLPLLQNSGARPCVFTVQEKQRGAAVTCLGTVPAKQRPDETLHRGWAMAERNAHLTVHSTPLTSPF